MRFSRDSRAYCSLVNGTLHRFARLSGEHCTCVNETQHVVQGNTYQVNIAHCEGNIARLSMKHSTLVKGTR